MVTIWCEAWRRVLWALCGRKVARGDEIRGGDDGSEFTVEVSRGDIGEGLRGDVRAVEPGAAECVSRIDGEIGGVSQISGHSGCCFTAVVRSDPADYHRRNPLGREPCVQVWRAVETGVHLLVDEEIWSADDDVLKRVTGRVRMERGSGVGGIVLDIHDWPRAIAPMCDECGDMGLTAGVIAFAPERGIVESLLNVDDDQGRRAKAIVRIHSSILGVPEL